MTNSSSALETDDTCPFCSVSYPSKKISVSTFFSSSNYRNCWRKLQPGSTGGFYCCTEPQLPVPFPAHR